MTFCFGSLFYRPWRRTLFGQDVGASGARPLWARMLVGLVVPMLALVTSTGDGYGLALTGLCEFGAYSLWCPCG